MNQTCKKILLTLVSSYALCSFAGAQAPVAPAAPVEPSIEKGDKSAPVKPAEAKPVEQPEPVKNTKIYGWKEWAWVVKSDVLVRAKLDSGARTSSIHATNIEQIEIDGKKWIKFTISNPDDAKGSRIRHKAPLLRISKIKNDTGGLDERFVVPLTFQIGDRKLMGEFNLNDRSQMTCAMLIGRNLLQELGYVDSSRIDTLEKPKSKK